MSKIKKYIALDTNILVSFFEAGFGIVSQEGIYRETEEIKVLDNLLQALNDNKIELIASEIIILECKRIQSEKGEELSKIYDKAIKSVQDTTIPPNKKIAQDTFEKIQENMKMLRDEEKKKNIEAWKLLQQILNHKNTNVIKLNEKIFLEAYKRGVAKKKPFVMGYSSSNNPIHDIQPDCIIIESIISFLKDKEKFELYLCTNDSDFFTSNEKKEIDVGIQKELHAKDFFLTLSELLNKVLGLKSVKKKKIEDKEVVSAYPLAEKSIIDKGKGEGEEVLEIVKS